MPICTEGETLFAEGRIDEAKARFEEVIKSHPACKEAHNNLGVIAYSEFHFGKAAGHFSRALEIDPFYKDAITNLCEVLNETGQLAGARNLLEVACIKYPDDDYLANLLTMALQATMVQSSDAVQPARDILKLRVLQGTHEIANQSYTISEALKKTGMTSKTLCYYPNYFKYKSDYVYDLTRCADREDAIAKSRELADQMIPQFDIFHFHFATTLTYDYSDLPILQEQKKKVVTQYWGSEIRLLSRAKELNPYIKIKGKPEEVIREQLEAMSRFVDHCIVGDYELYEYVKDYFKHIHVIPSLIDIDAYKPDPERKPNDKFLIVHAPTDTGIKGSETVARVMDELSDDYDIEYRLIKGMSHEEAKQNYQQADLIVDELHCGSYGLLSVETMAMAKPVITWICDFMKEKYPAELPILSANPDTLKSVVRHVLDNRDMLDELGQRGRAYVEKYHDMNKVVKKIQDVYRLL
ncbi:MAG: tetratricopeptide repeat protein [Candidatus Zixiibacteriota bacterium]